ncbi:MAG: hypothetical protein J5J00_10745 [Deltaproteobacteria bacterium]|nr:hypothetical protein [Deltaproteobacteria bacterium]
MSARSDPLSKIFLVVGGILLLFGVPFTLIGVNTLTSEYRYSNEGLKTTATVIAKRIEESKDSKNNFIKSYLFRYSFKPLEGAALEAEDYIDEEFYAATEDGASIEVQYLADDPAGTSRVIDGREGDYLAGGLFLGIGALTSIAALWFLRSSLRRIFLHRRLLREGAIADAEVISVEQSSLSINDVPQYVIKYTYADYRGMMHQGVSHYISPEEAERWNIGDKGRIRFDKKNGALNIWIGNETR